MHHMALANSAIMALALSTGCASSAGTKPHDMTTAQHEAAASQEQEAAQQHGQQYAPDAKQESTRCQRGACWTSVVNPTAQHQADEQQHEKVAAEHRAAAQALREAEANACAGIDETDRVTTPFYHREDISMVAPVQRPKPTGLDVNQTAFAGGRAVFRAVPGMTAEWLQRLVNCHLARAAAVGNAMPEMNYCPLVLKGVSATVSSVGDGFAIDVTSDDPKTAAEILRRLQALKS